MYNAAFFTFDAHRMLEIVYVITGLVLMVFAGLTFRDQKNPRRIGSSLFWLTLAIVFLLGSIMPHWLTGLLVLVMAGLDGAGRVTRGDYNEPPKTELLEQARRLKDKIFIPVLLIPAITLAVAITLVLLNKSLGLTLDVNNGTLVGLVFSSLIAMAVCLKLTGASVGLMMNEGRRLNDSMGTVSILPQLLASLGVIFTAAKLGDLVAGGIQHIVPEHNLFLLVLANCLGMALFTIVMGNSFAAFPVIATAVFAPLIIKPFGVNPAMWQ